MFISYVVYITYNGKLFRTAVKLGHFKKFSVGMALCACGCRNGLRGMVDTWVEISYLCMEF